MVVADRLVAMAAAVSQAGPDRAPAEVALLGVGAAALIAVTAVVIRRGRVRRWRPGRALLNAVRAGRRTSADKAAVGDRPDDGRFRDTRPDLAQPDDVRAGAEPDGDDAAGARRWRPQAGVLVPAAAVILLASGMGMAVVMGGSGHGPASRGSAAAGVDPGPGQPLVTVTPSGGDPAPGKHPAKAARAATPASGHPSGRGAAAASGAGFGSSSSHPAGPGAPAPSTGPGTGSGGTTPPPAQPALVLPAGPIELQPTTSLNPEYVCSFTITAEGGTVSYTIAAPAAAGGTNITITPSSGTLTSGQQATITVSMDLPASYVTVSPGAGTVQFTWVHGHIN